VAENKVAPMYQKKQATAQQAEAVVDALMKVFGSLRYSLRSFRAATRIGSPGIGFRKMPNLCSAVEQR